MNSALIYSHPKDLHEPALEKTMFSNIFSTVDLDSLLDWCYLYVL